MFGKKYEAETILRKKRISAFPKEVIKEVNAGKDLFSALYAKNIQEMKHKTKNEVQGKRVSKKKFSKRPNLDVVREEEEVQAIDVNFLDSFDELLKGTRPLSHVSQDVKAVSVDEDKENSGDLLKSQEIASPRRFFPRGLKIPSGATKSRNKKKTKKYVMHFFNDSIGLDDSGETEAFVEKPLSHVSQETKKYELPYSKYGMRLDDSGETEAFVEDFLAGLINIRHERRKGWNWENDTEKSKVALLRRSPSSLPDNTDSEEDTCDSVSKKSSENKDISKKKFVERRKKDLLAPVNSTPDKNARKMQSIIPCILSPIIPTVGHCLERKRNAQTNKEERKLQDTLSDLEVSQTIASVEKLHVDPEYDDFERHMKPCVNHESTELSFHENTPSHPLNHEGRILLSTDPFEDSKTILNLETFSNGSSKVCAMKESKIETVSCDQKNVHDEQNVTISSDYKDYPQNLSMSRPVLKDSEYSGTEMEPSMQMCKIDTRKEKDFSALVDGSFENTFPLRSATVSPVFKNENSSRSMSMHQSSKETENCNQLEEGTHMDMSKQEVTASVLYHSVRRSHAVLPLASHDFGKGKRESVFRELYLHSCVSSPPPDLCSASVKDNLDGRQSEEITFKDIVLDYCKQTDILDFCEALHDCDLESWDKIGEGVYGEVFSCKNNGDEPSVAKIMPIEGGCEINLAKQKTYEEILPEIVITKELSSLRTNYDFSTSNYPVLIRCVCVQGAYPSKLLQLWHEFDEKKTSENDSPEGLPRDQIYIILTMSNVGSPMESFTFHSAEQSWSAFKQVTFTLAAAEAYLEFEHRDLHWGNILIKPTKAREISFKLYGKSYIVKSHGIQASVIDFTLSRITYDGCSIYNNLAEDPTLFEGAGDYQFDIYRLMRDRTKNKWEEFTPFTNVLWLSYVLEKLLNGVYYRNKSGKIHNRGLRKLRQLRKSVLLFNSAVDVALSFGDSN